jgi:anti-sigma factor RsiW
MRRRCERVARLAPSLLDGRLAASPDDVAHLESCLRCQAELARYRRLARLLAKLRDERAELPPGLVFDVLASVERVARRRAARSGSRRRAALAGGLTAAVALVGVALASRGHPLAGRGQHSPARS